MTNQLYYGDNLQALRDCTSMNGRSYSGVMVKEERPYHIQAIYDLKADYSPEHFRFAIGECRKVIAQLIAEEKAQTNKSRGYTFCGIWIFNFRVLSVGLKMKPT